MSSIGLRLARFARRYSRNEQVGIVQDYALKTLPLGWLWCNGQILLSDTPHQVLRSLLIADGFAYGQDGSGNPRLPDCRGCVSAGRDDMGGSAAGRLTMADSGVNGALLGALGGAQTHTLTTGQIPSHGHGVTDPGHAHSVYDPGHTRGT